MCTKFYTQRYFNPYGHSSGEANISKLCAVAGLSRLTFFFFRVLAILTVKVPVRVTGKRKQKKLKLAIEAEGWILDGCN